MRRGVPGVRPDRPAVRLQGLVIAPQRRQRIGSGSVRRGIPGIDLKRPVVRLQGLGVAAHPVQHGGPSKMRRGIPGIDPKRPVARHQGLGAAAHPVQHGGPSKMRRGVPGDRPDRPAVRLQGLGAAAKRGQRIGPGRMRRGIPGIDLKRPVARLQGLGVAAKRGQRDPLGAQKKHLVAPLGLAAPLHDRLVALEQALPAVRQRSRRGGPCKIHPDQRLVVAREHPADQRLDRRVQGAHVDVGILRAVDNPVAAGEDDIQGLRRLLVQDEAEPDLVEDRPQIVHARYVPAYGDDFGPCHLPDAVKVVALHDDLGRFVVGVAHKVGLPEMPPGLLDRGRQPDYDNVRIVRIGAVQPAFQSI